MGTLATPDAELAGELHLIVGRSRELLRNNADAVALQRAWSSNIVGPTGLQHFPRVQNAKKKLNNSVNNTLRDWWKDWSQQPTVCGRYSLVELLKLISDTDFGDGEFFAIEIEGPEAGPHGYQVQIISTDQVDRTYTRSGNATTNAIRMGVEVDPFNRPVAYWIWDYAPGDIVIGSGKRLRIPADRVIHYAEPRRSGQTRGIPRLAPALYALKSNAAYQKAEVTAALLGAMLAITFEQDKEVDIVGPDGKNVNTVALDLKEATVRILPPGVSMKMNTVQHPAAIYESFVRVGKRDSSNAVGVAYHTATGDLSQANWVSTRAGDLQQRDVYMYQHQRLAKLLERMYRKALKNSLAFGTLSLPNPDWRTYAAVDFEGRGWSWTNPIQDGAAAAMEVALGVNSRQRIAREMGLNYEDICREIAEDKAVEAKYGISRPDPLPSGVTESLVPLVAAIVGDGEKPDPNTPKPEANDDDKPGT